MVRRLIPVFACDCHPASLHGLIGILEAADGIELIGSALTADACLAGPDEQDSVVYIVDQVPRDVMEATLFQKLLATDPTRRLIAYSAYDHIALVASAYASGASAFVSKLKPQQALLDAIAAVAQLPRRRDRHYPGDVAVDLADFYSDGGGAPSPRQLLTPRELEIFVLAADGYAQDDIAEALNIHPRTVGNRLVIIRHKLGISREHFRSHAIAFGLIDPNRNRTGTPTGPGSTHLFAVPSGSR